MTFKLRKKKRQHEMAFSELKKRYQHVEYKRKAKTILSTTKMRVISFVVV